MRHRGFITAAIAVVAAVTVVPSGCQKPAKPVPMVDLESTASTSLRDVLFDVTVEPSADDPRIVDVWVDASNPKLWESLPDDPEDERWSRLIVMRRLDSTDAEPAPRPSGFGGGRRRSPQPPGMAGTCELVGERLRFRPRYPLLPGEAYRVEFHRRVIPGFEPPGGILAMPVATWHLVPSIKPDTVPQIAAVYPTTETVPSNHLKFYIVFSEPMRQGKIWDHFELINETTGQRVPEPFRETELWSEDGRRLTLWFHPGRQKTGVNLNVEIGPILEEGNRYTLVISKDWLSQKGAAFAEAFRKTFSAGPKDRGQLQLADWKVTPPLAGSREALAIEFPEPLDWALLQSRLRVETAAGERVEGHIETGPEERSWKFLPATDWHAGEYRIAAAAILEDLAGNSLARPFEVDLDDAPGAALAEVLYLPVRVTEAAGGN